MNATIRPYIDAISRIREMEPVLRQQGTTALHVFGSRIRGDNRADSDLDVFVEYDPASGFSLLDLVRIKRLLEERTGLTVDIITREGIKPFLRDEIEGSAIRVF